MTLPHTKTLVAAALAAALAGCTPEKPEALLASARSYLEANDANAAVIQLKNALQQSPDLAEARFLLGRTLLETGDLPAAEKELRKAADLGYPPDQVAPLLARALSLQGEFRKVTEEFSDTALSSPQGTAMLKTTLGQAQLALGKPEPARDAFAAALEAEPRHLPALLGQAQLKAQDGDLPGALAMVESALDGDPRQADGWLLKGDILLAQQQVGPALQAYRKAVELAPDSVPAQGALVRLLVQEKQLDEAKRQAETMEAVAPNRFETLFLKALVAFARKDFPVAREASEQELKLAPDHLQGLLLAGAIEYELKSYGRAQAHLQRVLQRVPLQLDARRMLINSHLRQGQPERALEALKPIVGRIGKHSDMLALAGEVHLQNGEAEEAEEYFAQAAALDPGHAGKQIGLAVSRIAQGEATQGLAELERIAAADSGTRADLILIAAQMKRRNFDGALKAIAALEKKLPESPAPQVMRGSSLLGKGAPDEARRSFQAALAMKPDFYPAIAGLAALDVAEGKRGAARQRFEALLAREQNHLQAQLAVARLRADEGASTDEVAALIGKAVAAHPASPTARLALIGHYLGAKAPKKAVAAAQEAITVMPDRPEIQDAAGRAHQAAGETNQALASFTKFAALRPDSPVPYLRMAETQLAAKNGEAARQHLRRALVLKPDLLEAQRGLMALDLQDGRVEQAVALAREVQKQRPAQAVGFLLEGDLHAARKAWAEAAEAYRAGLKRVAAPELAVKLHGVLLAAHKDAEAARFAAEWTKAHPQDRMFRLQLAQAATSGKDYGAAARHYRTLLEERPDDPLVLNNLAWVSGQLKDPKALAYAERANALAPNQPGILDTLGVLLVERGEVEKGLAYLKQASKLAPQAAAIRLNLAKGLIKAGETGAARKELDALSKLGDSFPGHAEIARLQESL